MQCKTMPTVGKLDLSTLRNGAHPVHRVGGISADNCADFVQREVIDRVPVCNGGTGYCCGLEDFLRQFGWLDNPPRPQGLFSRLFAEQASPARARRRSQVTVITGGEISDEDRARQVVIPDIRRSIALGDDDLNQWLLLDGLVAWQKAGPAAPTPRTGFV